LKADVGKQIPKFSAERLATEMLSFSETCLPTSFIGVTSATFLTSATSWFGFPRLGSKPLNEINQGPMLCFFNIFAEKFSKQIGVFDSKQSQILKKM
jgi:hypothetical protein